MGGFNPTYYVRFIFNAYTHTLFTPLFIPLFTRFCGVRNAPALLDKRNTQVGILAYGLEHELQRKQYTSTSGPTLSQPQDRMH
jgi:hypothetical protein